MRGQWIDTNVENNKPTFIQIKGNPFDLNVNKLNTPNLINLGNKISEIPDEIKLLFVWVDGPAPSPS